MMRGAYNIECSMATHDYYVNMYDLSIISQLAYMMIALVVIYIITVTPGRITDALRDSYIIKSSGIFYIKKVKGTVDMVRGINSWTNVVVYTLISR